jgi:Flp pilus assembly protein TadD
LETAARKSRGGEKGTNMSDKKDLIIHLSIFIFFLISVFTSCSTVFYQKNLGLSSDTGAAQIPQTDLMQFATNLRSRTQDPDSLYQQARHFQEINKHRLALAALEDTILADPKSARAYNAMGVSYDCLQNFKSAALAYKRALELDPEFADAHNNLGYSSFLQGNLDAAMDAFKDAINLQPRNPKYHNNLALAYAQKGEYDNALAEFKIAGNEAQAHYNIAQIYYQTGEFEKARSHLDRATIIAPDRQLTKTGLLAATALAEITGTQLDNPSDVPDNKIPYLIEIDTAGKKKLRYKIAAANMENSTNIGLAEENDIFQSIRELQPHDLMADLENPNNFKDVQVEVTNGNGVNRMASRVGIYLASKGLHVTRYTNADHFNFNQTKIYYHDDFLQDAFNVAKHIPGLQNMEKCKEFNQENIKIKVVLGKDLVPYDRLITSKLDRIDKANKSSAL